MATFSAALALSVRNSPVNYPHKDQWRGALMFSLICTWTNGWVNNRDADHLRRRRAHYDITVVTWDVPRHLALSELNRSIHGSMYMYSSTPQKLMTSSRFHSADINATLFAKRVTFFVFVNYSSICWKKKKKQTKNGLFKAVVSGHRSHSCNPLACQRDIYNSGHNNFLCRSEIKIFVFEVSTIITNTIRATLNAKIPSAT